MKLSQVIRFARQRAELSAKDLAKRLNRSVQWVSRVELDQSEYRQNIDAALNELNFLPVHIKLKK